MLNNNSIKNLQPKETRYIVNDDRGLYLEIMPSGKKAWRFRYSFKGKKNKISLGSYPEISLSDARKKRDELRVQLANGIDPQEKRRQEKALTDEKYHFENIAREWHKKFKSRWTEGHAELTLTRLENNVFPYLGKTPISEITPPKFLEVLRFIEKRGALETAKRVRGICSMVFRYAIACGLAERDSAQDLQGALTPPKGKHLASITDPKKRGNTMKTMYNPKIKSALGSSWENVQKELFTAEEIRESNLRVALIGELIKARQEQGISQKKLEELSGVKQPVIARMETGQTSPQLDTVLKLLAPLGKTLAIVPLDTAETEKV